METGREIDPDTGEPIDYDNDSCEVDRSLCDDDQRQNIEPSESEIWNGLDSWRGKTKTNGESGKKRRYFEWDYTHGEIEVYDRRGNHLGAIDPRSGELIKEAVDGRSIDVS